MKRESSAISKTVGYYVAFIGLGLVGAMLGPTLPGLAEHTHSQLNQISFLFTTWSLGYLLGALTGGQLYDHLSGHPIMSGSLVVIAAMLVLVPLMHVLWLLAAVLLLAGVAAGILDVGGNTLLVWVYRGKVGPFMNGLHFFFGVGALLSPIIVAQVVLQSGDINWAYWVFALSMLPMTFYLVRLSSPAPLKKAEEDAVQRRENNILVLLVAVFFLLSTGAETSFAGWIYTYATSLGLSDAVGAAYLTATFWGAFTVGRLLSIPLSIRFQPRTLLLWDLIGCIISIGIILIWPGSRLVMWLGSAGFGLAIASAFPVAIVMAERRMTITGRVTSCFFVGGSLGTMLFPWLIGQLFEPVGPQVTMIAIGAVLVLAAGVYVVMIQFQPTRIVQSVQSS